MLSQCPMGMLSSFTHYQFPTIDRHDYSTNKLTSYTALTLNNIPTIAKLCCIDAEDVEPYPNFSSAPKL